MAASVAIAAAGIWLAWKIYGGGRGLEGGRGWAEKYPATHRVLLNKYWVDEAYDATVVRPLAAVSRFFFRVVDSEIIEGTVHAGPNLSRIAGQFVRLTTTGNVRNYALYFLGGVLLLLWWLLA
jgi:NADH-quinone oxidoreductase subunit L